MSASNSAYRPGETIPTLIDHEKRLVCLGAHDRLKDNDIAELFRQSEHLEAIIDSLKERIGALEKKIAERHE